MLKLGAGIAKTLLTYAGPVTSSAATLKSCLSAMDICMLALQFAAILGYPRAHIRMKPLCLCSWGKRSDFVSPRVPSISLSSEWAVNMPVQKVLRDCEVSNRICGKEQRLDTSQTTGWSAPDRCATALHSALRLELTCVCSSRIPHLGIFYIVYAAALPPVSSPPNVTVPRGVFASELKTCGIHLTWNARHTSGFLWVTGHSPAFQSLTPDHVDPRTSPLFEFIYSPPRTILVSPWTLSPRPTFDGLQQHTAKYGL